MNAKTRILVVDDDLQIIQAIARILRSRRDDWEVRTAVSARSALVMLAVEPADVVLSDMRMPGMDGAAFLAVVKETYPATIRIVLSGQGTVEAADAVARVTDYVLEKPLTSRALIQMLQDVIENLVEPVLAPP